MVCQCYRKYSQKAVRKMKQNLLSAYPAQQTLTTSDGSFSKPWARCSNNARCKSSVRLMSFGFVVACAQDAQRNRFMCINVYWTFLPKMQSQVRNNQRRNQQQQHRKAKQWTHTSLWQSSPTRALSSTWYSINQSHLLILYTRFSVRYYKLYLNCKTKGGELKWCPRIIHVQNTEQ